MAGRIEAKTVSPEDVAKIIQPFLHGHRYRELVVDELLECLTIVELIKIQYGICRRMTVFMNGIQEGKDALDNL